jgi:hypothetical protein
MSLRFKGSGKKLTDDILKAIERKAEIELPSDYRRFLLDQNGGEPRPSHFTCGRNEYEVTRFISFDHETPQEFAGQDFEQALDSLRSDLMLPKHLVPIAWADDDVVLLSVAGKNRNNVFFWWRISEGFDGSHCKKVANSFAEFLASLKYSEEEIPWREMIVNGDVQGFRRWLASVDLKNAILPESAFPLADTCMAHALDEGQAEIVMLLVENGVDASAMFLNAIINGQLKIANALFPRIRAISKDQLQDAFCSRGIWSNPQLVDLLIKAGADVNYKDELGRTPLEFASEFGGPEAAQWLLDRGAKPHVDGGQ